MSIMPMKNSSDIIGYGTHNLPICSPVPKPTALPRALVKEKLEICPILMKLEFSRVFRKILEYQISRKSDQWEPSCYVRTEGRTAMTKLFAILRPRQIKTISKRLTVREIL